MLWYLWGLPSCAARPDLARITGGWLSFKMLPLPRVVFCDLLLLLSHHLVFPLLGTKPASSGQNHLAYQLAGTGLPVILVTPLTQHFEPLFALSILFCSYSLHARADKTQPTKFSNHHIPTFTSSNLSNPTCLSNSS